MSSSRNQLERREHVVKLARPVLGRQCAAGLHKTVNPHRRQSDLLKLVNNIPPAPLRAEGPGPERRNQKVRESGTSKSTVTRVAGRLLFSTPLDLQRRSGSQALSRGRGLPTSLDSGHLDSTEIAVQALPTSLDSGHLDSSEIAVQAHCSSVPLQLPWKSSVFGQALASCTFEVRGPSDDPRSLQALGVGSQVQAAGCLRNPHGFCRLLS